MNGAVAPAMSGLGWCIVLYCIVLTQQNRGETLQAVNITQISPLQCPAARDVTTARSLATRKQYL